MNAYIRERIFTIYPLPHKTMGKFLRRACRYEVKQGDELIHCDELFFEFPSTVTPPAEDDCDSYLIALIMEAMMCADRIYVNGSVTPHLLANLTEFQAAWHCWLPEKMNVNQIEALNIVPDKPRNDKVMAAFSGGLDAAFTTWRHSQSLAGHLTKRPKLGAFIHGYDIPLSEEAFFELSFKHIAETLDSIHLPLVPIRSNFREVSKTPWKYSHTTAFIGAFSQLKNEAGTLLFGSSEPYNALVLPWGTNPVTDHLLSAADYRVIHDGAAYSRSQKTELVKQWPAAVDNIRVCWQETGEQLNCCKCEKCLRSTMNFLASKAAIPQSLSCDIPLEERISNFRLKGKVAINEWSLAIKLAQKNGVEAPWLVAAIRKYKQSKNRTLRKQLKRNLRKKLLGKLWKEKDDSTKAT